MNATTFLSAASFEALLGNRPYLRFDGGLLFFHRELGQYVMAVFAPEGSYTVHDYNQLPEEAPFQLINGKFIETMGASLRHQEISTNLILEIGAYIKKHNLGKLLHAPTDVVLGEQNVFQPDLLFVSVARQSQLEAKRIVGAPEFVVEILSKSTENNDRTVKLTEYGRYDVLEYWLVNPIEEFVEVYHNQQQQLELVQVAYKQDSIHSKAIVGLVVDLQHIF